LESTGKKSAGLLGVVLTLKTDAPVGLWNDQGCLKKAIKITLFLRHDLPAVSSAKRALWAGERRIGLMYE